MARGVATCTLLFLAIFLLGQMKADDAEMVVDGMPAQDEKEQTVIPARCKYL